MRLVSIAALLISGVAFSAGHPFTRFSPDNCATPSAACLFGNPTVTGKLTLTGTTAPQIDSTGAATLEVRSGATGGTVAFRIAASNNLTGTILEVGEIISGTFEPRFTVDQLGQIRAYNNGVEGGGLELYGAIASTSGASDAPIVTKGGVVSTGGTVRVFSARTGFDVEQLNIRGGGGGFQVLGAATGSLVPCNGSATGLVNFDTTKGKPTWCNGTAQLDVAYFIEGSGAQNPASIPANTCTVFTIAQSGLTTSDTALCSWPDGLDANLSATCKPGTDVIAWKLCNPTVAAIDPANGTYRWKVVR